MKKSKLTDILNKIVAQTPEPRVKPDPLPVSPIDPPDPDIFIGVCCRPNGQCFYIRPGEERYCNDGVSNFVPGGTCPDSCGETNFSEGICYNCQTRTCSVISDCFEEDQVRACIESGGKAHCPDAIEDMPSCQTLFDSCDGDPGSKPGACCMVATQPAPAFYMGCINVDNAQVCSDMEMQSGGIISTFFQEGKECGLRGPGGRHQNYDKTADCPMSHDEYFAPVGACCKRCYGRNEYGQLTLVSKSCFYSRGGPCIAKNYTDENGNPGPNHPDFVYPQDGIFCSYSYGGDETYCANDPGGTNPDDPEEPYCDGKFTPEDNDYPEHPYPWVE